MTRVYLILISIALLFNSWPVEFVHRLVEEHEEVHHCDWDYCISEFTHHCQLDKQLLTKKYVLEPEFSSEQFITAQQIDVFLQIDFIDGYQSFQRGRSPPAFMV